MTRDLVSDEQAADLPRSLAPERRERIREIVEARRGARLETLSLALGVSQATIRRDLEHLASEGRLRRVHGGAVAMHESTIEPLFDAKAVEAPEEKERIAARAVQLLSPEDTVYLDSGSTVLALARLLAGWRQLTVVTNSIPIAMELLDRGPRLIIIGGELRQTSRALVGPLTRLMLQSLHFDRAVMGTFALSLENGLMTTDPAEAFTKELVLTQAHEVILLADSRKIWSSSFAYAGRLEAVDIIVTDRGVADSALRSLERRGIKVITV